METTVLTFHVPGHQQGRGADPRFRDFLARHALAGDITQVLGMDDIHRPESVCLRAQQLAAQAYGVDHTYFLVNGSTSGNHAMILAALRPGEAILIPRNVHRSVVGAVMLAGVEPIFYEVPHDAELGLDHTATLELVAAAWEGARQAKALFVTSPTYYGATADLDGLARWAHQREMVVLVDEAWGPHLHFHPDLPRSAVEAGADMVVHSTHKLMSGLSQASMLHLQGTRIDRARLEDVVKILQSTSPNCLIVASLDVARRQMSLQGRPLLDQVLRLTDLARRGINGIPGMRCHSLSGRAHGWDPTRLVISAVDLGLSGYDLEEALRRRHHIQIEMSEMLHAVALITLGHTEEDVMRLLEALREIAPPQPGPEQLQRLALARHSRSGLPELPNQAMGLRQAFDAPHQALPLEEAVGRVCAEVIAPYPPGIPLLCPGQVISPQVVDYLQEELAAGAHIQGAQDHSLETIRVIVGVP